MASLKVLWINDTKVSDPGLCGSETFAEPHRLAQGRSRRDHGRRFGLPGGPDEPDDTGDLEDTKVSDSGLKHLERLTKLEWINLDGTRSHGCRPVHPKRLPNCRRQPPWSG